MATIQRLWSTKRRFRILAMIVGVALIYLLPFFAMPGLAAIYMKMDGIEGESVTPGFEKMVRIDSVSWGVGRAVAAPTGGSADRETSAPSFSEVTLSKPMDKASVLLFKEAIAGQDKTAILYFTRSVNGVEQTYYEIGLTNVLLSGYSQGSGGDTPTESLSLNYAKIGLKYTPYLSGKMLPPVTAGYDLSTGKAQ